MLFCKRNAPTILTCVGAVGVVATSILAVKATPKATKLLKQAEEDKGEELTKMDIVRVAGPAYIPAIVTGVSTIACIFSANVLNNRQQAAITSAYALLDRSYKDYKKKVDELYGEAAGIRVREEIARDKYEEEDVFDEEDDGKELFYDYFSERYFRSTLAKVRDAEYELNRYIVMQDYAYLNDFYEQLGLPPIDSGLELGWTPGGNEARYWQSWVDFIHEKVVTDDGLECTLVMFHQEPYLDFGSY